MTNPGKNGRDGQADSSRHLPEVNGCSVDDRRSPRRTQHDEGRFRWARHEHAGFGGRTGARTIELEQARCYDSFNQYYARNRRDKCRPIVGDVTQVDLHTDCDQEHTES